MNGGIYSLKSTSNDRFVKKLFMAILYYDRMASGQYLYNKCFQLLALIKMPLRINELTDDLRVDCSCMSGRTKSLTKTTNDTILINFFIRGLPFIFRD